VRELPYAPGAKVAVKITCSTQILAEPGNVEEGLGRGHLAIQFVHIARLVSKLRKGSSYLSYMISMDCSS
jgi:hypothetical protein